MKKTIFILSVLLLLGVCAHGEETGFVRGLWVASVSNLDYPSRPGLSESELRAEANEVLSATAELGMNTVFFQVRPAADALYNSNLFPKSAYLGETDFDPLAYFVCEAHKRGIKLHAWINPYRVTLRAKDWNNVSELSPAKLHPELLLKATDGNYFFNPGLPQVRELITNGVREIIENYDVDGIHFDDYFYPDSGFDDSEAYEAYGEGLGLEEWRIENVNALVRDVHSLIESEKPSVEFGISPRGIWANQSDNARGSATKGGGSLTNIYCDSLRFIEEGWVDYICPQLYWSIGYEIADYEILLNWWSEAVSGTNVKLFVGMADYRSAESEEGDEWYGTDELERQLELNKTFPLSGEVHFRYGSIKNNTALYELYKNRSNTPSRKDKLRENLLRIIRLLIFHA